MAAFNTIVARTGFADQIKARLNDDSWSGPEAENEAGAIEAATEQFEQSASMSGWELAPESVSAYEMYEVYDELYEGDEVVGWDVDGDGWPTIEED